eukprot:8906699-Pyramimonas_sp.AAC.1
MIWTSQLSLGNPTVRSRDRLREGAVSARSGISAMPERDMLHIVLMVNTDGQMGMRADEGAFMNMPTTSASRPCARDEFPTAWIFERSPIAEGEARGCVNVFTSLSRNDWVLEQWRRKGMYGTTLSAVPAIFGERHELALAANSGAMVDGMLTILWTSAATSGSTYGPIRDAIEDLGLQVMRMRFCHFGPKCVRSSKLPSGSYLQVATTFTRIPTNMWRCTCQTAGKPAQFTEHELDWFGQGAQKA